MAEDLKTISAPALTTGYGQNIKDTFTNIDENFKILGNRDINKGDSGTGVISLNISFSDLLTENESFDYGDYTFQSQLSNFTEMFKKVKKGLTGEDPEDTDVDVTRSIECLKTSGRSICVLFDEPAPEYTGVISIKTTIPYVFKDDSFIEEYNSTTRNIEYDLSGVISYDYNFIETNPWNCKQLFPTLYYNSNPENENLYWVIDGSNTTIPAQGVAGKNGIDGKLWIGLVDAEDTPITPGNVTITKIMTNDGWKLVSGLDSSSLPTNGSPIVLLPEYIPDDNSLTSYAISTIIVGVNNECTAILTNDNILYASMTSQEFINCMKNIKDYDDTVDDQRPIPGYFFKNNGSDNNGYIFFREGNQLILRKVTDVADPDTRVTSEKTYQLIIDGDVNLNIGEGNQTSESNPTPAGRGTNSLAVGRYAHAYGNVSQAFGQETTASGQYSHAEGYRTAASGTGSHAEGNGVTASGQYSHAEGISTTANGNYSHAEGSETTAGGLCAHTEGIKTTTNADGAHAEGRAFNEGIINASGQGSHVGGYSSGSSSEISASNQGAFAHGYANSGSSGESRILASGQGSFAHGYANNGIISASGNGAHAEGIGTTASGTGAHAEGNGTKAEGDYSHAEGFIFDNGSVNVNVNLSFKQQGGNINTYLVNSSVDIATGDILLGGNNIVKVVDRGVSNNEILVNGSLGTGASINAILNPRGSYGIGSHAEGYNTLAYGEYSHAEGSNTLAIEGYSHATGILNAPGYAYSIPRTATSATEPISFISGIYNGKSYTDPIIFSVGSGFDSTHEEPRRSNGFFVTKSGKVWVRKSLGQVSYVDDNTTTTYSTDTYTWINI